MCDTLVALPNATLQKNVLFAKSADCEINEANALVRIPGSKHVKGETVRLSHLVIPQAEQTYEVILTKAFWTYGCEIGINEFGLSMGEEAVFTTEMAKEQKTGIIGPDMLRIGLERSRNCKEAIQIMTRLLEEYGQGGSAELRGNSHFDSNYLMADSSEAYILETAGRQWAFKQVDSVGAISNMLAIHTDWQICPAARGQRDFDWAAAFGLAEILPTIGSVERQAASYGCLEEKRDQITVKTLFNVMRHHNDGYNPATEPVSTNICMHAGPQENRWWQADGAMVTDVGVDGAMAWVTGTSGTCLSIFKPVFLGVALPDIGPIPTEHFDPTSLWWKHELLHRRAMADFEHLMPDIRKEFDVLEAEFLQQAATVKKGIPAHKYEFMEYCFRKAMQATETWIAALSARSDLSFKDQAYGALWHRFNYAAGLTGLPE